MSIITTIENAIIQLGPGEFQKFCDTFLSRQDQHGSLLGLGMKSGTLKTTIGNPDTYFRKENGKYVFVAYTCQQNGIYEKLKDDIEKCLDPEKTKLPIDAIEEIICCHTSSNLLAGDDQKLHTLCEEKNIKLILIGVDELAQQVYNHYPKLAKDFLNIPLDTNQIMTIDDFIDLYDSNEMAAPLNTIFLERKEELSRVIQALENCKVVIVHGAAGTGKTRLVLEACKQFSEKQGFILLCVKNNNQPLYEDLVAKTEKKSNYVFFVDDANELAGIPQILQYVSNSDVDLSVKVIMTVRDYVKENVIRTVSQVTKPDLIQLDSFSDDDITKFLDLNLGIKNSLYVEQIIRIAEGNPRIAYMAGRIAKEKQTLSSIHDASEVYDQYYAGVVEPRMGNDRKLCLTSGILALLNAVFLNRLNGLSDLLRSGNISEDTFKECIYTLSKMEVVEIHKDMVASISDQCLSNYMLYYTFFKQREIPFSDVLYVGYKQFKEGVVRSINTLFHIFSTESLCNYISNEVKKVWDKYESEGERCFEDFVVTFHMFRPEDAFLIAEEKIKSINSCVVENKHIDFDKHVMNNDEKILGLLSGYGNSLYLKTAIELLLEYVAKSEENTIVGFQFIKNVYGIDQDSCLYGFYSEQTVCNTLLNYSGENLYVLRFMLAVIKEYLKFEFRPAEMGRGNTFRLYHLELSNDENVIKYRKLCWEIATKLAQILELKTDFESFLKQYAISIRGANDKDVVLEDKRYIETIMQQSSLGNLKRALITRDLYYGWTKLHVEYEKEDSVFSSKEWELFTALDDDFIYSDLEYDEYEKQHLSNLKKIANTITGEELRKLVYSAVELIKEFKFEKDRDKQYKITHSIEIIANSFNGDAEKNLALFEAALEKADELAINPGVVLKDLFCILTPNEIYVRINERQSAARNKWNFSFFESIPSEEVNKDIYDKLIVFLKDDSDREIKSSAYRSLRFLDKFMRIDEKIYIHASRIILEKTRYSTFIVEMYFALLFHEACYYPEKVVDLYSSDIPLLQDIYFFMLRRGTLEDLHGVFLQAFISVDETWIRKYADYIVSSINEGHDHDSYRYKTLWKTDDYIKYFDCIYETIASSKEYISEWRLSDEFRNILAWDSSDTELREKQEQWILHIVDEHAKDEKIVTLFHALSDANEELRKRALLELLKKNDDYELFERIPLDPSHWGGNVDEIIPQLTRRVEYLESLLRELNGVRYLKHAKRIRDRIDFWKERIKEEEIQMIYHRLYQ